jgi:hypothetical protein
MHIGICRILEPYGYYIFKHRDEEGWPHYTQIKELSGLSRDKQNELLIEAILKYFE